MEMEERRGGEGKPPFMLKNIHIDAEHLVPG
jgi:hypothetical protein